MALLWGAPALGTPPTAILSKREELRRERFYTTALPALCCMAAEQALSSFCLRTDRLRQFDCSSEWRGCNLLGFTQHHRQSNTMCQHNDLQ